MHAIKQDLTYALRLLVKQPGVTVIAILTLALGIGANTAIFSAVNAILLRPLPYADPDRLVMVFEKRLAEGVLDNVVSPADFLDWSKMNGAFDGIAAMSGANADLTGVGEPIRLAAGAVSPPFFDVLGVQPALGRNFRTEEAIVGQHRVVILSHDLWQNRFGSDASVVGRKILLNAIPHEVVGVLPSTFEFPNTELTLWSPLALEGGPQAPTRVNHFLSVYARLKPGVTLERARAEMDRVGAQLQQQYPEANRNHGAHVSPLRDQLQAPVRDGLLALLGAVAFVLLIACVNVANLLLAKAASRKREMAVRAALGAGRLRLAGQTLTESVLLALCGGAGGVLVAKWGIELLRQLAPQGVPVLGVDSRRARSARARLHVRSVDRHRPALRPASRVAPREPGRQRIAEGRRPLARRAPPAARGARRLRDRAGVAAPRGRGAHAAQLSDAAAGRAGLPSARRADRVHHAPGRPVPRRRQARRHLRRNRAPHGVAAGGSQRRRDEPPAPVGPGLAHGHRHRESRAHARHADAGAPARRHDRLFQDDGHQARFRAQLRRDRSQRVAVRRRRQRDDGAAVLARRLPGRQARALRGDVRRRPGARSSAS